MRIMGLDFGSKTVGVAVSDSLLITAQGVEIIRRKEANKLRQTLARIEELIEEYGVEEIVLGMPKNMNATEGERAELTYEFKDKLDLDDMLHPAEEGIPAAAADSGATSVQSEAVQALVALGYGSTESLKAVKKVKLEDATVEEVLKAALKNF